MNNATAQGASRGRLAHVERRTIEVPGLTVDLVDRDEALDVIRTRAQADHLPPLAVASINLDHVHHFGPTGRWSGTLDRGRTGHAVRTAHSMDWLNLIDGAPIATQSKRLTGRSWPRLAGSDLAGPILDLAEHNGLTVGFLGGSPETQQLLGERLAQDRPELQIAGFWAPARAELTDPERSAAIADEIRDAAVDILVVGVGKPRQELWIAEYGARTGARVLLAFGAVVDFLAGRVKRAPQWVARAHCEWAWRLMLEPRRLARRYLVDGPSAYLQVRRWSHRAAVPPRVQLTPLALRHPGPPAGGGFVPLRSAADVAVVMVTYNSAADIRALLDSLRAEAAGLRMHAVVIDNGSTDDTREIVRAQRGVVLRAGHGNIGYAAAINVALRQLQRPEPVLVLNPDLRLEPGAVRALLTRMAVSGAGVVVPRILEGDGVRTDSLRREPTLRRSLGEAVFGSRFRSRPGAFSEIDWDAESYDYAHPVEWSTGAALLVHPDILGLVGAWDERFFLYSEETDYFRRVRDAGASVWYEPAAVVRHRQGGSGASPRLDALMTVNRVRYARKHMTRTGAAAFGATVALHELARSYSAEHRLALRSLLSRRVRDGLPHATPAAAGGEVVLLRGARRSVAS